MYQLNEKTKVWGDVNTIEPKALNQIYVTSKLDIIDGLAVMPDCHFGNGATVGSVIAAKGAVLPAAVGVDIGCGMAAIKLNLTANDLPDSLADIRSNIESWVPVGFGRHEVGDTILKVRNDKLLKEVDSLLNEYKNVKVLESLDKDKNILQQVGTLGGGNHFIELCLDENQNVWLLLHSGSRNVGKCIAEIHISRAREALYKRHITIPDMDLAWFDKGTTDFDDYVHDVSWAQEYARLNRAVMINNVMGILTKIFPYLKGTEEAIYCHHNYVSKEIFGGVETYITRKGAVDASLGKLGLIPGSMGTKSYIVRGKGNTDSYNSCSHGAGRRMSRGEAKRTFTVQDLENQTLGVECRKDEGVVDEIPGAYKDIDEVMEAQKDLVDIVHTLKAVLCVKG